MYDFGGVALDCSKCCKMAVSLLNTSRACKNMFLMNIVRYDALKYEFLRIFLVQRNLTWHRRSSKTKQSSSLEDVNLMSCNEKQIYMFKIERITQTQVENALLFAGICSLAYMKCQSIAGFSLSFKFADTHLYTTLQTVAFWCLSRPRTKHNSPGRGFKKHRFPAGQVGQCPNHQDDAPPSGRVGQGIYLYFTQVPQ